MSASFSFAGWSWKAWVARNKDQVKMLIAAASGLATAWVSQHLMGDWASAAGLAVAVGTRFVLDVLDFWLTNVPSDQPPK